MPIGKKISQTKLVKYRAVDAQWVVEVMSDAGSRVNIVVLRGLLNVFSQTMID